MTRALQPPRENAVQRARSETAAQAKPSKTSKTSKPSAVWTWLDRWRSATRRAVARATTTTTNPPARKAAKKQKETQKTKNEKRRRRAGALLLEMQPLYLVRGEDGPFRGAPDPTMVVCAWNLGDHGPQTVLRSVVRFDVRAKLPAAAHPDVARLMSTALDRKAPVVLFVALFEENSGDDVRRLAAALEHPERLHFVELRRVHSASPAPNADTVCDGVRRSAVAGGDRYRRVGVQLRRRYLRLG